MGAPPPTRMAPMHTCTEERRLMLMGVQCYDTQARIGLSGESPAQAGTPKAEIPPGNAQAQERQTAAGATSVGLLESGGFALFPPTEGERRLRAPDLSGHRTEGRQAPGREGVAPAAFFVWLKVACGAFSSHATSGEVLWEDRPRFSSCTRS